MNPNSISTSSLSTSAGASADAISRRAYELWEEEGRPDGCDLRHWLQAEKELSAQGQNSTPPSRAIANGGPSSQPAEHHSMPATADVRPLQTGRTGTTPGRDTKRPPGVPAPGEKPRTSPGQIAGSGRRK